jgi:hypothetical protein
MDIEFRIMLLLGSLVLLLLAIIVARLCRVHPEQAAPSSVLTELFIQVRCVEGLSGSLMRSKQRESTAESVPTVTCRQTPMLKWMSRYHVLQVPRSFVEKPYVLAGCWPSSFCEVAWMGPLYK